MRAKAILVAALLLGIAAGIALGYFAKVHAATRQPSQELRQTENPKSLFDRKQIPRLAMAPRAAFHA